MGKYDMPYITLDLDTGPQTFGLKTEYWYCENCKENHFLIRLIGDDHEYKIHMDMEKDSIWIDDQVNGALEIANELANFLKKKGTYNEEYISFMYAVHRSFDQASEMEVLESQDGRMVGFSRIFGYEHLLHLVWDDRNYAIMDHYCVKLGCKCTTIVLDFYDGFSEGGEITPCSSIWYDYITGEIKDCKDLKNNVARRIGSEFDDEIRLIFEKRHDLLKELAESFLKNGDSIHGSRKREKVGRNDPCPCGSGKKYKKCCLPKQMGCAK